MEKDSELKFYNFTASTEIDAVISFRTYLNTNQRVVDNQWKLETDIKGGPDRCFFYVNSLSTKVIQCTEKMLDEHFVGVIPDEKDICIITEYKKDKSKEPEEFYVCGKAELIAEEIKKLQSKCTSLIMKYNELINSELKEMTYEN